MPCCTFLATNTLLPYLLLAIAFILLEQVIGEGTLGALLATLLAQAMWLVPWGMRRRTAPGW